MSEVSEVSKPSKIIDASGNIDVAVPKVAVVQKPRPPSRNEIIKKYRGKPCSLTYAYPCTLDMCSVAKCCRVQDLENATKGETTLNSREAVS